jgi:hypothetical protein
MVDILMGLLGVIHDIEVFPKDWKTGGIVPLFKKGDVRDLGNYRGITLLSMVGKLYERILNRRISVWVEDRGLLSDYQGGFRTDRSCPDQVFVVTEVIQSRRERGVGTFSCFIDVTKAYDTVWQEGLLWKLWKYGICGKVWRIFKEWYAEMVSSVVVDGNYTREFEIEQGVKQGAIASPMLYALFLDGVVEELRSRELGVVEEGEWNGIALFADDMVLMARNGEELQCMINVVEDYSRQWRFELSSAKSEVMISGERVKGREWKMGGNVLKVVSAFKYLGVDIQADGGWSVMNERIVQKARKRVDGLIGIGMRSKGFSVKIGVVMWETLVVPLLEYGAEIVRYNNKGIANMEVVQRDVGRRLLGVAASTPGEFVVKELGWWSMEARCDARRLKYFGRLVRMKESRLVKRLFVARFRVAQGSAKEDAAVVRRRNVSWCTETLAVLRKYNLSAWINTISWTNFPKRSLWESEVEKMVTMRERCEWESRASSKCTLDRYRLLKVNWGLEEYLSDASDERCAVALQAKLRSGTNGLRVSMGRREKNVLPRYKRICRVCEVGIVEDEKHFVDECVGVEVERRKMWNNVVNLAGGEDSVLAWKLKTASSEDRVLFALGADSGSLHANAPDGASRLLCRGLWKMYEKRKRHLFDVVV